MHGELVTWLNSTLLLDPFPCANICRTWVSCRPLAASRAHLPNLRPAIATASRASGTLA